jgi:non-specific serine/threonine protein kinase
MSTVQHFELLEKLGEGGMGVVYKAQDTRLQRNVALKFLTQNQIADPVARERLVREARAAAALNHPNIATVYDVGESPQGHFIAMEYVDGQSLFDFSELDAAGIDKCLTWGLQLCEAIAAAHDLGIVHRDIKSNNIMITVDHRIKVLDFGIALWESGGSDRGPGAKRLTETGDVVGTIYYMAPEILQGGKATTTSDVFSLGVVLYEMFTGALPFAGDVQAQIIYAIMNDEPAPLTEHRNEIPEPVARVVLWALDKDPENRYDSARELVDDLRRAMWESDAGQRARAVVTAAIAPSNLPSATNRFVGRDQELGELVERLGNCRLLTLTGPGGAGKTRTSLELAERTRNDFEGGVFQIELAPLTEPSQVVQAIAAVLDVREASEEGLIDSIVEHIGRARVLLILDNCEHLIGPCALAISSLLQSSPSTKVVATSQQRLGVPGEMVWQLATLSLPPEGAERAEVATTWEAVQLFVDRARLVRSDFDLNDRNAPAVVQICRRLDGNPLAIELAAVRVHLLPPEQILTRLEDRFQLLTGGSRTSLPRQQTLRATVEWSLDLLNADERRLFRLLSVFAGGTTLQGIERVCGGCGDAADVIDLLGLLVDKSLVIVRDGSDSEPRYQMLETLREYGTEELASSREETAVKQRHAEFVIALAEDAASQLTGPEQAAWFNRLHREMGNVRTAIAWLVTNNELDQAMRITASIWRFWLVRGYLSSGRELLAASLGDGPARPQGADATALRAQALFGAGVLAHDQGDDDAAHENLEACLVIRRELDDRRGIAETLNSLGIFARDRGDYKRARELLGEALEMNRDLNDKSGTAMSIHALGITAHREGDCDGARKLFEQGLAMRKELGDRRGIGALLAHLGSVDYDLEQYDRAEPLLSDALSIFRELENRRGIVYALMYIGGVARQRGQLDVARTHHEQCLSISRELGDKEHIVRSLEWLASDAAADKDYRRAVELEGAATAFRGAFHAPRTPMETQSLKKDLQPAFEHLGDDAAEAALSDGCGRTLDDVVARALRRR